MERKRIAAESAAHGYWGLKGFTKRLIATCALGIACAASSFCLHAASIVGSVPGNFSVSPTGAATYQIPIDVPPGVNGLKPSLALLYNSQAGNGLLGEGWSLTGLSVISRCPQTLDTDHAVHLPDLSTDDRFCLDGQRLVLTGGSPYGASGTTYHTEIESFQQVTASGTAGTGPASFTVVDRSGLTRTYGQVPGGTCILGGDGKTCLLWPIIQITDHYGNFIKFYYDVGFSDYVSGVQSGAFGLKEIDYGNSQNVIVGRVKFTYDGGYPGTFRGDSYTSYFAGAPITHNPVALTNIVVENGGGGALRTYNLNYTYGNTIPGSKPATTLDSVQECDDAGDCFAPTTFTYDGSPTAFNIGGDEITQGLPSSYQIADFDGDGLPDYVYVQNSALYVVFGDNLNTPIQVAATVNDNSTPGIDLIGATRIDLKGDGKQELLVQYFANPGVTPDLPTWDVLVWNGKTGTNANLYLQSAPTTDGSPLAVCQLGNNSCEATVATAISATGNGADGLLYTDDGKLYYYANTGGALKSTPTPTNISYTDINAKPPALVPVNYSGEGQAEVYVAGNGVIRWNPSISNFYMEQSGNFDDANNPVFFVNANGDGLSSAVVVVNGSSLCTSANTGLGFVFSSSDPLLFNNCATVSGIDLTQLQVIDWFGDGRQELIAPVNGTWYLFEPDTTGYVYSVNTGITVSGTPTRFLDVNGDGRADMVAPYGTGHTMIYYNAFRPYLLNQVTNGFGHHTDVGYIPLDQATHKAYVTGVASPLVNAPHVRSYMGPMYIVDDYAVDTGKFDSNDNPEQIYTYYLYGGAALDQWGRGFLGFHEVEAINYNTGLYTDVVYNQDFPFAGTVQSSTKSWNQNATLQSANVGSGGVKVTCNHLRAGEPDCEVTTSTVATPLATFTTGGQTLSVTTNTYKDDVSTYPGVYYPYNAESVTKLTEINASSPYETTTTNTTYSKVSGTTVTPIGIDVMPTDITVTTTPGTGSSTGPATVDTVTAYGQEATCPGRATSIQITNTFDGTTEPAKSESFVYDGNCFLTKDTKTIFDPSGSRGSMQLVKAYVPDGYGNPRTSNVSGTGVLARQTSTTYDAQGLFPISITNTLGQTETLTYNDWGQKLTDTDANGNTVRETYDGFGRKLKQIGPMPNVVTSLSYAACSLPCAYEVFESNSADSSPSVPDGGTPADSATEYDQLGRVIKTLKTAFDGGITEQDTQYDLLGHVTQVSKPYKSGGTPCFDFKTYDVLNRVLTDVSPATASACGYTPPSTSARTLTVQYQGLKTTKTITAPSPNVPSEQTVTISNVLGKPDSVTDAGGTTQYKYDPWGNLVSVTPPDGNQVTMTYDSAGDKLTMHDPDMGAWSYTYDALGELLTQTDAKSQTVTDTYDALGRLVTRSEPEGVTTWKYDIAYGAGIGRLAYTVGPNGVWEGYAYDAYGNTTDKITVVNGQEYWVTDTYDNQGRVSQVVYPNLAGIDVNAAPATPTGLTAAPDPDNNAQIDLTWTLAQNGQIYHLYRTVSGASAPNDSDEIYSGPSANWADDTITSNGTYEWWLKACNDTNCSGYTTVTLTVTLPPTAPASLTTPGSDTHSRSLNLGWAGSSLVSTTAGPISYVLEEKLPGSSAFGSPSTLSATTDTVTLNTNGTYAFRVRACASNVCSAWRYSADYTTVLTPGNPGSPSVLTSVTPTSSPASYTVSWSAPGFVGGPVNYELQEENTLDASPQFVDVIPGPGSNTSELITKSKDGKYLYQVRACDVTETSVCSSYVVASAPVAVTLPPTNPGVPTLPSSDTHYWSWSVAFNSSTLNSGSSGSITYELQQSWNGGSWASVGGTPYVSTVDNSVSFNAAAVKQSGVYQDGTYTYRARACTTDPATGGTACTSYVQSAGGYTTVIAPGAPGSLTTPSLVTGDGAFTATYTAPAAGTGGAATSYKVQLGDQSCDPNLGCKTLWVDGNCTSTTLACSFPAGKVQSGDYLTRVQAFNGSVPGDYLTTGGITVHVIVATGLTSTAATSQTGSYTLSWNAVTYATSYELQRASQSNYSDATMVQNTSATSYAVTGAGNGTYYYRVRGCASSSECGAWSTLTELVTLPPAVPTNVGVAPLSDPAPKYTLHTTNSGNYTVNWTAPASGIVTAYKVYESVNGGSYALIQTLSPSQTSASITGRGSATQDIQYTYYVEACNQGACSDSDLTDVTVTLQPPPPGTPTISPAVSSNGNFTLTWTVPVSGVVTSYNVLESTDNTTFTLVGTRITGTSWSPGSALGNGAYYYDVEACNQYNCSTPSPSNEVLVYMPPGAPNGVSVSPGTSTNGSYTVSWGAPTSGEYTYYRLYESVNGGSYTLIADNLSTSTLSYPLSGKGSHSSNYTYRYEVAACNHVATSCTMSGAASVVVAYPPTGAPSSLSISPSTSTNGAATLSWGSGTSGVVTSYEIFTSTNNSTYSEAGSTSSTSWPASGLGNGTHYYKVRACNDTASNCSSSYSPVASVLVTLPPGAPGTVSLPSTSNWDGSFTVSWGAASGQLTAYHVNLGEWDGETKTYLWVDGNCSTSGATSCTFGAKKIPNGHYYARVYACNQTACGSATMAGNQITVSILTAPSAPSLSGPSTVSSGSATLSWSAPATATSYELFKQVYSRRYGTWGAWSQIYSGSGRSYTDTFGINAEYIDYYVIACNQAGCSGQSNTLKVTYNVAGGTTCGTKLCLVMPEDDLVMELKHPLLPTVSLFSDKVKKAARIVVPMPGAISERELLAEKAAPADSAAENRSATNELARATQTSSRMAFFLAHAARRTALASRKHIGTPSIHLVSGTTRYATVDPKLSAYPPLRHDPRVAAHFESQGGVFPARLERVDCGTTDSDSDCSEPIGGEALMVGYVYNSAGYLTEVQKLDSGGNPVRVLWQATHMTAAGQVDQESFDAATDGSGEAFSISDTYDAANGLLTGTTATTTPTTGDALAASYSWDGYNNLTQRNLSETVASGTAPPALTENFGYDALNRLTNSSLSAGNYAGNASNNYNAVGGFLTKGDYSSNGDYTNYQYDPNHPHAVASLTTPTGVTRTFSYDANGNLLAEGGDVTRTVTWTSYNKPSQITGNGATENFLYGPSRERLVTQVIKGSGGAADTVTTTYIDGLFEQVYDSASGTTNYKHYIVAGGVRVGVETLTADSAGQVTADTLGFYVHDEVGSVIATVTENMGGSNQTLTLWSYDAWGKARPTTGADAYQDPAAGTYLNPTQTGQHEGYAAHENLDDVGLVDMEGRVYDPEVGRFLSPDPNVQYPDSSQGYDRYTYVNDNPLSLSDPSGYFSVRQGVALVAAIVMTYYGDAEGWAWYETSFASGAVSGYIGSGNLQTGVESGLEAVAFSYVGDQVGWGDSAGDLFAKSVTEGVIGGAFSMAGGGRFSDGFLGAFASSELSSAIGRIGGDAHDPGYFSTVHIAERVIVSAVVGGTVSRLTGGDFGDGAVAAAMQRLFNDERTHHYRYHVKLCSSANVACTEENAWSALKHYAYPGQDHSTSVNNGGKYYVMDSPTKGAIQVFVNDQTMTETNVTESTHIFCCGRVTQHIMSEPDGVYLDITGSGSNSSRFTEWFNYGASLVFPLWEAPGIRVQILHSYWEQTGIWQNKY